MPTLITDQTKDSVLRRISKAVDPEEFNSQKLRKILQEMSQTLAACVEGVALAAPQIGVSKRIFIVGEKAFSVEAKVEKWLGDLIFINPIIIRHSRRQSDLQEGCLSIPNWYGLVRRWERVSVEAYNEKGEKFTRHASGLLAQIFQHEIDHLNGILFVDSAKNLQELTDNNNEN